MTTEGATDEELMLKLGRRDMSALGELARRHQQRILELAFRTLGKWDAAEDVAQETFLRVYRAAKGYRPQAMFTTWLYRIVINLCLDERRKRARNGTSLDDMTVEARAEPDRDLTERKELSQLVQAAIAELPERQRVTVVLHRYDGLTHAQIAQVTGWTPSAVESLLVRAYANLREKLSKTKHSAK